MGPGTGILGGGRRTRAVQMTSFCGPPYGAMTRCTGWCLTHSGGPTGTIGGVPYGATKRCTGWWLARAG
eukprot:4095082-Pyramimonas_sp.AAC.1